MTSPLAGLILAATASCLAAEVTVLSPRAHVIRSESHTQKRADAEAASAASAGTAEVVIAGDGSWATARTARQNQGRSSMEAASFAERTQMHGRTFVESTMKAFGFGDNCQNLFWAGWMRTNGCRDEQMPEYNLPSCRCERSGTAFPAKFCMLKTAMPSTSDKVKDDRVWAAKDMAHQVLQMHQREMQRHIEAYTATMGVSNQSSTATAAPSSATLLQQKSFEDPGSDTFGTVEDNPDKISGVGDLSALEYEVFGGCDKCCERKFYFYWGIMAIPLTCCLCCFACCWRCHVIQSHNKLLRRQLESATVRLTQAHARDQAIFNAIDQNRDGELSAEEFTNQQTMRALHTIMDRDQNNAVNFSEFNQVGTSRPAGQ